MAADISKSATTEMVRRGFEGFKGKTLESHVQELMDREEIRELINRYAQRVSRGINMADMFVEDGSFLVHTVGFPDYEAKGRAEIEKSFGAVISKPTRNMPCIHNHLVQVNGDEALATSFIELQLSDDKRDEGRIFAGSGYYEDKLRRVNGRWMFVQREAFVVIVGPAQKEKPIAGGK
jgi:hypothetical protein